MPQTSTGRRVQKKTEARPFDKYDLYTKAVQSPEGDVEFLSQVYKELREKNPISFREDFCGTFALSTEWVKLNRKHISYGVDLDPEPMDYGRTHFVPKLRKDQKDRLHLIEGDVLAQALPVVDIAAALNFSYFSFKERDVLKKYFHQVIKSLRRDGLFFMDVFGGSQCGDEIEDAHPHRQFTYYWDQTGFDPVSNEAVFHIHFKVGRTKHEKVFTYDWRMWSIPELRDLLREVGFQKTHVYWEGTNRKGEGNGVFTRTEKGEPCESWIAYIVAEK